MLQHDVESISLAGWCWDEPAGKWRPPHGAPAGKKGLPVVGANVYWEHPSAEVLVMRYRWTHWPAGVTERWLPGSRACRVVNKKTERYDVYIGRPSEWGNPFVIGPDGTRDEVIAKYRKWIISRPELLYRTRELSGKTLGCFCSPESCHGDVLSEMAALPWAVVDWVLQGGAIEAHNNMFERLAWHHVLTPQHGFPEPRPEQWHCSAATARVNALPGGLERLGEALGLDTRKDAEGKRLMRKFSMPRDRTKLDQRTRIMPSEEPVEFAAYDQYCATDVLVEAEAMSRMAPMTPDERRFWLIDQEINWRGIAIDRAGVRDCIAVLDEALERYGAECRAITGGLGPSQVTALLGWINGRLAGPRVPTPTEHILEDEIPY